MQLNNATLLLTVVFLTGLICACQDAADSPPLKEDSMKSIPFDKEGTLTFHPSTGLDSVTIAIEIADTDSARSRGLMQRASLPQKSGMLFIFDREEPRSFWMANTPLSLDIIFVNNDSSIVNIAKYTKPRSPKQIRSEGNARYVVEVPAGFTDRYGIVAGDRLSWHQSNG